MRRKKSSAMREGRGKSCEKRRVLKTKSPVVGARGEWRPSANIYPPHRKRLARQQKRKRQKKETVPNENETKMKESRRRKGGGAEPHKNNGISPPLASVPDPWETTPIPAAKTCTSKRSSSSSEAPTQLSERAPQTKGTGEDRRNQNSYIKNGFGGHKQGDVPRRKCQPPPVGRSVRPQSA